MATSPLRPKAEEELAAGYNPLRPQRGVFSEQDLVNATLAPDMDFQRGLQSAAAGISGSFLADEALRAEKSGKKGYQALRDQAIRSAEAAQMRAPRMRSLRDAGGVGDIVDFIQGGAPQALMSTLPSLAAGIATRGKGTGLLSKGTAYAGAAVPAYWQERGEAALDQYTDPTLAAMPVEERDKAATGKALVNAALESLVPGSLANTFGRKQAANTFAKRIGKEALTEGATEAAQEVSGFAAQKYLDPNRQLDPWNLADAAVLGAVGGGGMTTLTHGPQVLAAEIAKSNNSSTAVQAPTDLSGAPVEPSPSPIRPDGGVPLGDPQESGSSFIDKMSERFGPGMQQAAKSAEDFVTSTATRMREAATEATTPTEFLRKVFNTDSAEAASADLTETPAALLQGATLEETAANVQQDDAQRAERAASYAEELNNDPATPPSIKEQLSKFAGDFSSKAAQTFAATQLASQRLTQKASEQVNNLLDIAKKFGTDAPITTATGERTVKKNLQDASPSEKAAFSKVIFDNLTEEAKANPEVRSQLSAVTNAVMAFAARTGDITAKDLPALTRLSDAMKLFKDPDALTQQLIEYTAIPRDTTSFLGRIKQIQGAQQDIRQPNSFLTSSLTPEARSALSPKQLEKVAQLVDNFSIQDATSSKQGDVITAGLASAFGSPENARIVLDYYAQQNKSNLKFDENEMLQEGVSETSDELEQPGTTELGATLQGMTVGDGPKSSYQFADAKTLRPFKAFAGTKGKEANRAIRDLIASGSVGPDAQGKVVPYSKYVEDKGLSAESEVARLKRDIVNRGKQALAGLAREYGISNPSSEQALREAYQRMQKGEKSPELASTRIENIRALMGEQSMLEQALKKSPKDALDLYEVSEIADKEQNDIIATDEDLAAYARLANVKEAKNTRITFNRADGTKLLLSAESMWKAQGDKEGSGKGEATKSRAKRLFAEAVARVLARPEITGIAGTGITTVTGKFNNKESKQNNTFPPNLIIDRKLNLPAQPQRNTRSTERSSNLLEAAPTLEKLKERLSNLVTEVEELLTEKSVDLEDRPTDIVDILQQNIDRQQSRADELGIKYKKLGKNTPARAVITQQMDIVQEKLKLYREAQSEINNLLFEYKAENQNEDAEPLSRLRKEMDTSNRARQAEEDTGLGLGTEKRAIKPTAPETVKIEPKKKEAEKKSSMEPSPSEGITTILDAEERQKIVDEVVRIRGKDVKVLFDTFTNIKGSGEFSMNADKTERLIKIAIDSINPMSVAWHESLHDFFAMIGTTPAERKLKADMLATASAPQINAKLRELLKDHPAALEQIRTDKEERLAYTYQFWAEGALKLGPTGTNIFARAAQFFKGMLGILSEEEKLGTILDALHDGKFIKNHLIGEVIADLHAETLGDRIKRLAGPLNTVSEKLLSSTTDRLRDTNIDALNELADAFYRPPGAESAGLPFMQRRAQQVGQKLNRIQDILKGTTAAQRREAIENLQAMRAPSSPLEKALVDNFKQLHEYMVSKGVKRFEPSKEKGKKGTWKPLGFIENYFPRVWDKATIREKQDDFIAALTPYIGEQQARETVAAIVNSDGSLELTENEHSLGFTPFAASVQNRSFDFINESNAGEFTKFMSKDLSNTLTTYVQRAVHRAEYASEFGNAGEVITEKLAEAAKQGASKAELDMAKKAVMALEGTMGYDFNPKLKEVMGAVISMENIILLPLSLFTNFVDPLGVALRSNDMKEAGKAFMYGIKGLVDGIRRKGPDEKTEMARTLGLIDEQNMLDAMGQAYNSAHMGKALQRVNSTFFKLNGMEMWNQRMRTAAMVAGQRFIIKNVDNKRYMEELGLTKNDVFENPDGTLAITKDQIQAAAKNKLGEGDLAEIEKRVQAAIFKFVDGAVLRPNAAHRPIWGSDPRFQLIFHLKQFTYSFQEVILKRVKSEMQNGNAMPAMVLLSYVPFMIASDLLKGSLTGSINSTSSVTGFLSHAVARSGILGTGTFVSDAVTDATKGKVPGSSFLGPAFDHLMTLIGGAVGRVDAGRVVDRTLPLVKYL